MTCFGGGRLNGFYGYMAGAMWQPTGRTCSFQDTDSLVKVNIIERIDGKFVYDEFTMHACVLINKIFLNAPKNQIKLIPHWDSILQPSVL